MFRRKWKQFFNSWRTKNVEKDEAEWPEKFKNNVDLTLNVIIKMNEYLSNHNINLNVYMIPMDLIGGMRMF